MLRIEYFDKDRFMRQVSASRGSVLLHLDNGKTCDLKEDAAASCNWPENSRLPARETGQGAFCCI